MSHVDVLADYTQRILGDIRLARPMKIVVDSGNGIAGASAPGIFRALGCEVIELFSEVDGEFPNHHPDPSKPENLQDLMQALSLALDLIDMPHIRKQLKDLVPGYQAEGDVVDWVWMENERLATM